MFSLIGREYQISYLHSKLKKVVKNSLEIVFIAGEAGVGKTTLLNAFAEKTRKEFPDFLVIGSRCQAIAGGSQEPYLPFLQILGVLSDQTKDNIRRERFRQAISELAPDWIQVLPGVGDLISAIVRTAQWGLKEYNGGTPSEMNSRLLQYTNFLKFVSQSAPLLLWIEDLHWSDAATLDLISFLADNASNSQIMLLITYRNTDVVNGVNNTLHPVKKLIAKLTRYDQCATLDLSKFSMQDLEEFLRRSQHRFPGEFVEQLFKYSGGNPLFIKEYVTLLHRRRLVRREQGQFVLVKRDLNINMPDSLDAVIEQRLSLIGEDLRKILDYASVQGANFTSRVLSSLMATQELALYERLNLLERTHKLIKELEEQRLIYKIGSEYQFVHALIQQAIYNDLSAGQRSKLHLSIAELLENLYGEDVDQYATDLAIHFERGGNLERAIKYYIQASQNALASMALDDALAQATVAQRIASHSEKRTVPTTKLVKVLILTIEIHFYKASFKEAIRLSYEAEEICKRGSYIEEYARILYWRSRSLYLEAKRVDAVTPVRMALEILGNDPASSYLKGHLYALLGALYLVIPLNEAQSSLRNSILIADKYNYADVKVRALIAQGWIAMNRLDDPQYAVQVSLEALNLAQEHNLIYEQITCHRLSAYAYRHLKQSSLALTHNEEAVRLSRQHGMARMLHVSLSNLAESIKVVEEDWWKSIEVTRESIQIAEQFKFPISDFVINDLFNRVIGLGLWKEAEKIHSLYAKSIGSAFLSDRGDYYRQAGHMAYARGYYLQAADMYEKAIEAFDTHGHDERDSQYIYPYLGLALLAEGKLNESADLFNASLAYWKGKRASKYAECLYGLGCVNLAQGNLQVAIGQLLEAWQIIEGMYYEEPWPIWPSVCVELGRAYLVANDLSRAYDYAIVGYEKLKKIRHIMFGNAAFVLGRILLTQGKVDVASDYLNEVRNDWTRLELQHFLPQLDII